MGLLISKVDMNQIMAQLSEQYDIYAPKVFEGEGCFSDTDVIRYGIVTEAEQIETEKKSEYSFKEVLLPVKEILFYYSEDSVTVPKESPKGKIIFVRSCDLHAVKRLDEIYLRNGFEDFYYNRIRANTKFILIGCESSYENCFCVSMGSNECDNYDAYVDIKQDTVYLDSKWDALSHLLENVNALTIEEPIKKVTENQVNVSIPETLNPSIMKSKVWDEYSERCIACGRCNFVCPTCTCFSMQDISYKENKNSGERRRVWASCQVDGYTNMAGGHSFRVDKGQRMRFKVMHKVYDFKKRNGYHMCVGCGRCDDICPEYISFSACINKLEDAMKEV